MKTKSVFYHTSEITGSTWCVWFNSEWYVTRCWINDKPLKITPALDLLLFKYLNKHYEL